MKPKFIAIFYALIGIINLYTHFSEDTLLNELTKAALMPTLLFWMYQEANGVVTLPRLIMALALIFSWLGDLFLMQHTEELKFLFGLGMFLIAQLLYSFVMFKSSFRHPVFQLKSMIPIMIYGPVLLYFILPKAGILQVPVAAYALCILLMVSLAHLRKGLTSDGSYQITLTGAWLFIVSDSLIALDKFSVSIPAAGFWIMLTYIVAQYLIVAGLMKHPT